MVVLTQSRHPVHSGVVGLHVGAENVVLHFPRGIDAVELELDHLNIVCTLEPSFWEDRPEIHDMRLSLWLESKRNSGKLVGKNAEVSLVPSGEHKFRVLLTVVEEISLADKVYEVPGLDPDLMKTHVATLLPMLVPSLDRRKHGAVHAPERRRVGRLKSDEPTPITANH
jgi:hypothetical protein